MRARGPDNEYPAGEASATQIVLAFDDNRLASTLFGQYGQNLALIERRLGVVAEQRGNHVTLAGTREGVERSRRVRSEERRVGKECRWRWAACDYKKNR